MKATSQSLPYRPRWGCNDAQPSCSGAKRAEAGGGPRLLLPDVRADVHELPAGQDLPRVPLSGQIQTSGHRKPERH